MRGSVLNRWMAIAAIDPWDENRGDLRAGEIAAATANSQGAKKSSGEHFAPEDFMRFHWAQLDPDELQRQQDEQVSTQLKEWLMNNSGHVASKDRDHLKEQD